MANYHIHPASEDNLIGLVYVLATCWIYGYSDDAYGISEDDIRSIDFKEQLAQWRHMLLSPSYKTWVAREGDNVVGWVALYKAVDKEHEILGPYVLPDHKGKKLGSDLLTQATEAAEQDASKLIVRIPIYAARAADFLQLHDFMIEPAARVKPYRTGSGKDIPFVQFSRIFGPDPHTEKEWLTRKELAEEANLRESTLKHYIEFGLVPFEQHGEGMRRMFRRQPSLDLLQRIADLRDQGLSLAEIKRKL